MVGWWPFNGNANDESGNGNNGIVNGASLVADRYGITNAAYSFDGINNVITVANSTSLNFETSNQYSISYWINAMSISNSQAQIIATKQTGTGSNQDGWNSFIEPNSILNFYVQNGFGQPYSGCNFGIVSPGQFYHVVQTFAPDSVHVYLDGLLVGKASSNGATVGDNLNSLLFGKASWVSGNTKGFNGTLDDIGIWNRALTQQEITQLYLSSTQNVGIGTTNPQRRLHVVDVMRLEPRNTEPSNPAKGDIYFDGIINKLRVYDGTTWQNCW